MTVATEASYANQQYTGVELTFSPGFAALAAADVHVGYFDADGLPIELTLGVHFTVTLDVNGAVTVGRIALPSASPLAPVTMWFERITPAVQGVDFENLATYDAGVHEQIADAGAMRDAELRNRQGRTVTPFQVSETAVDFRPHVVKAADPQSPEDLVTKLYSDTHTGTAAQEAAEAARDVAIAQATIATSEADIAVGAANSASVSAAILGNPDYGFVADVPTATRDYGTLT